MTLVTAHCHRKVSSLGWEEEFPVFILTFCLLLALGLTSNGRIMAVSVWSNVKEEAWRGDWKAGQEKQIH